MANAVRELDMDIAGEVANPLEDLQDDLTIMGCAHSLRIATLSYLCTLTRRIEGAERVCPLICGPSGSGKSVLGETICCSLVPAEDLVEAVSLTEAAFFGLEDLSGKVVFLDENCSDMGVRKLLRMLVSSGRVSRMVSEGGRPVRHEVRGPACLVETTVSPERLDYESRTRAMTMQINESEYWREQLTDAVHAKWLPAPDQRTSREAVKAKHRALQQRIPNGSVIQIPFVRSIRFSARVPHELRLLNQVLSLVGAAALYRVYGSVPDDGAVHQPVVATVGDYALVHGLLITTEIPVDDELLPQKSRQLLSFMQQLAGDRATETPITRNDIISASSERAHEPSDADPGDLPEWTYRAVRSYIEPLVKLGLLTHKPGPRGRRDYYLTSSTPIPDHEHCNTFLLLPHPSRIVDQGSTLDDESGGGS